MLDEAVFTAGDLMTRDVATVRPDASLLDAVKLMAQRRVSGMPVMDSSGTIVGMLSGSDLLRWHEGHTDRQAHWLEMLAEGQHLAPEFLRGIQEQNRKVNTVMTRGGCDRHGRHAGARDRAIDAREADQARTRRARW